VDAGSLELVTNPVGETDFSGAQRIYNGRLDIGAFEADWRGVYAKDLAPRRLIVTQASENVEESDEKTVVVPAGERLEAEWGGSSDGRAVFCTLKANVAAGATLKVWLNESELASIAGDGTEKTVEFTSDCAENRLRFECGGETGVAELYAFRRYAGGAQIFVR
jgi:hypothetical protein